MAIQTLLDHSHRHPHIMFHPPPNPPCFPAQVILLAIQTLLDEKEVNILSSAQHAAHILFVRTSSVHSSTHSP